MEDKDKPRDMCRPIYLRGGAQNVTNLEEPFTNDKPQRELDQNKAS